jgi:hypothetical protein
MCISSKLGCGCAPFGEWLQAHVHGALDCNEIVNKDIVRLSQPPSLVAYLYASMWAYGNHYHVEEVGVACHTTFDFGII